MKKQSRIIKIDDNFSKIELYSTDDSNFTNKFSSILVVVNSRTFSGKFQTVISNNVFYDFKKSKKIWKQKVEKDNLDETLSFKSDNKNICFEIKALSKTKIIWLIKLKPFLHDIEILSLKIETELHLVNSLE